MSTLAHENANSATEYVAGAMDRQLPPDVIDAARMCLADWLAVGIGAHDQGAGRAVRDTVAVWSSAGRSPVFQGGRQSSLVSSTVPANCMSN